MNGDPNGRPTSGGGRSSSSPDYCDQQKLLPAWSAKPPIVVHTTKTSNFSIKSR